MAREVTNRLYPDQNNISVSLLYIYIYIHNTDGGLVSLVGKVPVYRAGGAGSIPGRTTTQGLKIIEEKVLPLL